MPCGNARIRERRDELGFTQHELAVRADVSPRSVQFAEAGRKEVKQSTLAAIADALGLAYGDVVQDREDKQAFEKWSWTLSGFLRSRLVPPELAFCETESDAQWAIGQMRKNWYHHLERTGAQNDALFGTADRELDERFVVAST